MFPNMTSLVGVFEYCIEIKKQVATTMRCNLDDLKVLWYGELIPDDMKLSEFCLPDSMFTEGMFIKKKLSHHATVMVDWNLQWRFSSDQSNNIAYVMQEPPPIQMQVQSRSYTQTVNFGSETVHTMRTLSEVELRPKESDARESSSANVDESTPSRLSKRQRDDESYGRAK